MTADDETITRVRQKLDEADRVDASRIELDRADDNVRLRGSVSTPEEATVAAMVAEEVLAAVENHLQVDPALRAAPNRWKPQGPAEPGGATADTVVADSQDALGENLPWDPPDEPHMAPTPSEERGALTRDATENTIEPEGQPGDAGDRSAADLSSEELRRSAHGDEPHDHGPEEA